MALLLIRLITKDSINMGLLLIRLITKDSINMGLLGEPRGSG
jgi:hypothetical protein